MIKDSALKLFEEKKVRSLWNEKEEKWYFSIIDVVSILTEQPTYQGARNYWKVLKSRLLKEGNETVTNCNRLKMEAEDGKMRETDVGDVEQLLRLIQSIPSPKAEPFKQWLAKVGYERMQEMADPAQSLDRARENIAGQYGILTTIELTKGFLLLKNSNITFEQFKNTIKQYVLITF